MIDLETIARADELLRVARVYTRGRAALSRALRHVSQREVAARCSVTPAAVAHWVAARTRPRREAQQTLLDVYGIELESWTQAKKKGREV